MLKNPYLNAVLAAAYIVIIVSGISLFANGTQNDNTLLIPVTMLSLFVLSAAVMGCLFVYPAAKLFLDNRRDEALVFFFKTLGTFACFAAIFVGLLLLR